MEEMINRLARERVERMSAAIERACLYSLTHTTTKGVEVHTYGDGGWSVNVTERVPWGEIHRHNHPGTSTNPGGPTVRIIKGIEP